MASATSNDANHGRWQRMLIVRLGAMGDIIHTLPAVTALRQVFPQASIGWIVEERWAELLCTLRTPRSGPLSAQRPLVDRIHTVNTQRWRHSLFSSQTWEQIASGLSELRAPHYQVAIDFQGAARSALLGRWSDAQTIYGSAQPRENIASMFYTRPVMTTGAHIVEQNMSLAEAVAGQLLEGTQAVFPVDAEAEAECEHRLEDRGIEEFVLLNPGAGWGAKRWPAERYGEVARSWGWPD
jgi:lipopolysaccharide heptosyltransferase I